MCGRKHRAAIDQFHTEAPPAYEGDTIRFDRQSAQPPRRAHHFPWWTLWLIWPLIGVIKASVPVAINGIGAWGAITVPLLPLVLIAVGALLLLHRRTQDRRADPPSTRDR